MKRRVVVTGLGVVTCLGCAVDELWERLLAGESGIHLLTVLDANNFKVKIGGDLPDWSPIGYIERKEVKRLDRVAQLALVAAVDAVPFVAVPARGQVLVLEHGAHQASGDVEDAQRHGLLTRQLEAQRRRRAG